MVCDIVLYAVKVVPMPDVKQSFIEVYKCPSCGDKLPVSGLKGSVTIYCRKCKNNIRLTNEVLGSVEQRKKELKRNHL